MNDDNDPQIRPLYDKMGRRKLMLHRTRILLDENKKPIVRLADFPGPLIQKLDVLFYVGYFIYF